MNTRVFDDRYFVVGSDSVEYGGLEIRTSEIIDVLSKHSVVEIHALKLIVDAPLVIPSGKVLISARTLAVQKNSDGLAPYFSVSGKSGGLPWSDPLPAAPGNAGANGGRSGDGQSGGRLTIIAAHTNQIECYANGGAGQDAQSGQPGGRGMPGPEGRRTRNAEPEASRGGQGQVGQQGGLAGTPGSGGDGGVISKRIFALTSGDVSPFVDPGHPGKRGKHGAPGDGGPGGIGGERWSCEDLNMPRGGDERRGLSNAETMRREHCENIGRGPYGPEGPRGPERSEVVPDAERTAKSGSVTDIASGALDGQTLPWRFARFLLLAAEADSIRGDCGEAAGKLGWLLELLELYGNSRSKRSLAVTAQIRAALTQLLLRNSEISRGSALTPQLALGNYDGAIKDALQLYEQITPELRDLRQQSSDEAVRQKAYEKIKRELLRLSVEHRQTETELQQKRPKLEAELATLDKSLVEVWRTILEADADFRSRVAEMAACAKFVNVLAGAATVVTAVATGGSGALGAYAGLLKLWRDLGHGEKDDKEYPEWVRNKLSSNSRRIKLIEEVKGGSGKVTEAVEKFKEFMDIKEISPPSDTIKFWMTREEFARMIEPYKSLAEAKHLISLMDNFFTIRDNRHDLILSFDSMVTEIDELRAQIELASLLEEEYVEENAAVLLSNAQRLYEDAQWINLAFRNRMFRLLGEASNAYYYWALSQYIFNIDSLDPVRLADAVLRFQNEIRRQLNARGPATLFPSKVVPPLCIRLPASQYRAQIEQFISGNQIYVSTGRFSIDGAPIGLFGVRANHIEVVLRTTGGKREELATIVVHQGDSEVAASNGQVHRFKHEKRGARALTRVVGIDKEFEGAFTAENLNGTDSGMPDANFIGVSPFATWSLRLLTAAKLDVRNVKSLELYFGGSGYVRTDPAAEDLAELVNSPTAASHINLTARYFTFGYWKPSDEH